MSIEQVDQMKRSFCFLRIIPKILQFVKPKDVHQEMNRTKYRGDILEIGFIGAGKAGKALGLYFKSHGLSISGYYSKTLQSAQEAAGLTQSKAFTSVSELTHSSSLIFITVPDHAFGAIDRQISALIAAQNCDMNKIWIHLSGAHPSDYLAGIKAAGGEVASMHPLLSFGEATVSAGHLERAWFTLEGSERAVSTAMELLSKTGGKYSQIKAADKPLYHAGACVVSNFLVTLLDSGLSLFEASGMERGNIFSAIEPLIDSTLSNIREKGTLDALTGPIVRGDFNTVDIHLKSIEAQLPTQLEFYRAMALKTVEIIDNIKLTNEQTKIFQKMLKETYYGA